MAFFSKAVSILRQTVSKHINHGVSACKPSIFQAIRCMSTSKVFVGGLAYATDDTCQFERSFWQIRRSHRRYGESPMSKGDKLHKGQCPQNALQRKGMEKIPYASLVGSLMYAQVCTRPDIAFVVNMLSKYQSNAGHEHWVAGRKVLRYSKNTRDHMLVYMKLEDQELRVEAYIDASYKQDLDDLKSISGYIFMLGGGAISWKTNKQSLPATSRFQEEYIAIYEATAHAIWLRNFILRLGW